MSERPKVSVVIASHGRPEALTLCLKALQYQSYRPFEVIVVACSDGMRTVQSLLFADRLKLVPQADQGLSVARNHGIAQAAGEVIAFIDDDAVAEPTWLARLVSALQETGAQAVGGWVRASNGISFEWTGGAVSRVLNRDSGAPTVMGTNMAVRAETLRAVGGFDPLYRYYLDETDLTTRIAQAGHNCVHAPWAQVHHLGAPNPHRGKKRMPKSLRQIGRSEAIFLRRHSRQEQREEAMARLRAECVMRLSPLVDSKKLKGRVAGRLLDDYDNGVEEGSHRDLHELSPLPGPTSAFKPFVDGPTPAPVFLSGRIWQRRRKFALARQRATQGHPVTLFLFSPTALFHTRRFTKDGFWLQTGGLFGRSDRTGDLFQFHRFQDRVNQEITRVAQCFCHSLRGDAAYAERSSRTDLKS